MRRCQVLCRRAFFPCASENIQIHGGIGFTWSTMPTSIFKRAKSSELLFGDTAYPGQSWRIARSVRALRGSRLEVRRSSRLEVRPKFEA